jgi:hypothetical protein
MKGVRWLCLDKADLILTPATHPRNNYPRKDLDNRAALRSNLSSH